MDQLPLQRVIGCRGYAERLRERGGNFDLTAIGAVVIDERSLRNPQHNVRTGTRFVGPSVESRNAFRHRNPLERFDPVDEPTYEPGLKMYGTGKNFVQEAICVWHCPESIDHSLKFNRTISDAAAKIRGPWRKEQMSWQPVAHVAGVCSLPRPRAASADVK